MSDKKYNDGITAIMKLAEQTGVATSSVSDGQIFVFKKSKITELVDKSDSEYITIFVKKDNGAIAVMN